MHCVNRDGGLQACHINPDCHNYLRVTDFTHPDIITFYERFLYSLNVPHTISQISLVSASQRGLPTAPSLPHTQQQRGQSTNSPHSQRTNNSNYTHSQRTSNTNSTQCAEQTTTPSGNVYCTKPPSNITEMQLCTTQDALHAVDYTYSEDDRGEQAASAPVDRRWPPGRGQPHEVQAT